MPELNLRLTLIDDVVASERPATEGGHASLDYLPGAMLLGAAAARLYGDLPRGDAYKLFHSGQVRFSDAVPLAGDAPCWPMPLCWHERKGEAAVEGEHLSDSRIRNLQHGDFAPGDQPKQLRDGYVGEDGRRLVIDKALRMKTAIDPSTGRVDEAQLFGYEAIRAGQHFTARIDADDDLPDSLWNRLTEVVTDADTLLFGRSRSAEYGRVQAVPMAVSCGPPASVAESRPGTLCLWCLSDLALVDQWGQPTLGPTPERLGLNRGQIDWGKSFLRFRRFAPWNAYRRAYDLERQVIRRGSVIALQGLDPALSAAERKQLAAGVGLHREIGMGRVCLDPLLLATPEPVFAARASAARTPSPASAEPPPRPDHPLIRWLESRNKDGAERAKAEERAKKAARALSERYRLARAFVGLAETSALPIGPSPAQWGSVYEKARTAGNFANVKKLLFEGDSAVCKSSGEGWQDEFHDEGGVRSFVAWFRATVDELQSIQALRAFGREAQRIARNSQGGRVQQEDAR